MARTWSTFNAPPQWGKLQGIPSDLADGEIDWNEIQNKPSTFTPTNHNHAFNTLAGVSLSLPASGEFLRYNGVNWINATATWSAIANKPFGNFASGINNGNRGVWIADSDGADNPVIHLNRGKTGFTQSLYLYIDFAYQDDADYNARIGMDSSRFFIDIPSTTHRFCILNLPTSSLGLPLGAIWRDSNGFVRAV